MNEYPLANGFYWIRDKTGTIGIVDSDDGKLYMHGYGLSVKLAHWPGADSTNTLHCEVLGPVEPYKPLDKP